MPSAPPNDSTTSPPDRWNAFTWSRRYVVAPEAGYSTRRPRSGRGRPSCLDDEREAEAVGARVAADLVERRRGPAGHVGVGREAERLGRRRVVPPVVVVVVPPSSVSAGRGPAAGRRTRCRSARRLDGARDLQLRGLDALDGAGATGDLPRLRRLAARDELDRRGLGGDRQRAALALRGPAAHAATCEPGASLTSSRAPAATVTTDWTVRGFGGRRGDHDQRRREGGERAGGFGSRSRSTPPPEPLFSLLGVMRLHRRAAAVRSEPLGLRPQRAARRLALDRDLEPLALLAGAPQRGGPPSTSTTPAPPTAFHTVLRIAGSVTTARDRGRAAAGRRWRAGARPRPAGGSAGGSQSSTIAHRRRACGLPIPAHSAKWAGVDGP